ncbi:hypothetical protein C8R45DRAFT_933557 [Mycena sanguinolenta]|nr:hypothetical protein C8R45DRAFT_933557 [Mycena sanguinolenta]
MDDSSSGAEIPLGMKKCAKPWCHILLPINDKKACAKCREAADAESEDGSKASETFTDAESFFDGLRTDFKSKQSVDFHGTYKVAVDELVTPKQRVQMVAAEIWKTTGYRFTVANHRELASGHRTRFWCCQDEARKKKSKASHDPDIRNRDYVGMKRFPQVPPQPRFRGSQDLVAVVRSNTK